MLVPSESPRRVVTGHDADGRSVVVADGPAPGVHSLQDQVVYEIWNTRATPAPILPVEPADPTDGPFHFPPARNGLTMVIAEKAPGIVEASHRTETIDCGIVLDGEINLVLTEGEVLLRKGDLFVQRGTEHGWENRSNETAKLLFFLIDGKFTDETRALIGSRR